MLVTSFNLINKCLLQTLVYFLENMICALLGITQLINPVNVHEKICQQDFMDINITVQSCTIRVGHTEFEF